MARGRGAKQFFNFVKGWITESSPMTYPENSAKDLSNVVLDIDGSIRRRPGIDFENQRKKFGLALTDAERDNWAIAVYPWENVGGSATANFIVTQIGLTLYFHRQNGQSTTDTLVGTVDLSPYAVDAAQAKETQVQVAAGMGTLFVVGPYIKPVYIEYSGAAFTATLISLDIRDFDGANDGLEVSVRPTTLTPAHLYNLLNQGWSIERINTFFGGTAVSTTATNIIITALGESGEAGKEFPSNADISYLGMKTNDDGDLVFDADELKAQTFGNTPAPKGHYILNAFNQYREAVSTVVGSGQTLIPAQPATVAFHNGRVFYAGINAQKATGNVYYSQQLTNINRAGRCYQEQDPTAEEFNDLLATDGGLIVIPGCGRVARLMESANGIVVFAANGVWEITGGSEPFSATNVAVRKVTDIGCVGARTVVEADGQFLYWSASGIIALAPDQITGQLNAQNISQNTIQIGYQLIGGLQHTNAQGEFIPEEKKVVWLYSTYAGYDGETQKHRYNGALILDIQLGAFYKYTIADTASTVPYVAGIVRTLPFTAGDVNEVVTVSGVNVTVSGEDVTVAGEAYTGQDFSTWKMLCTIDSDTASTTDLTFGEFYSRSFKDWYKKDGVGANYTSYLETGYELFGNAMVDKQPVYVFTYFSPESKSLKSGSYYELPPLIVSTLGVRTTQSVEEILVKGDSDMRTSQTVEEILIKPDSDMRVSQTVMEILEKVI